MATAKTALILGGTGQIGIAAAERLARDGWAVRSAHRGSTPFPEELTRLGVDEVLLDHDNTPQLVAAASGYDLVLDAVAFTPEHADQLARLSGIVGSLVVISTMSVYLGTNSSYLDVATGPDDFPTYPQVLREGDPTIANDALTYSSLKSAMERRLLTNPDLPVSILRPGAIHGAHSEALREWYFIKRVLDRRVLTPLAFRGASVFATSAAVNIAELVAVCAAKPGQRVLNAVDDEHLSVEEIATTVFTALGHDAEIVALDGPPLDGVGATPWSIPCRFEASMDAARNLGYTPAATYADAIEGAIRWAIDTVAAAEAIGGNWRDAFPHLAKRADADGWFDYDAEDAVLQR